MGFGKKPEWWVHAKTYRNKVLQKEKFFPSVEEAEAEQQHRRRSSIIRKEANCVEELGRKNGKEPSEGIKEKKNQVFTLKDCGEKIDREKNGVAGTLKGNITGGKQPQLTAHAGGALE